MPKRLGDVYQKHTLWAVERVMGLPVQQYKLCYQSRVGR
ncbi:hypothetical protein CXF72_10410 [Psychromonas sp. MB-3u-54]|nr:hypothetical protein CXF72_10410 [Psychromonas sp. MB-3u-54]